VIEVHESGIVISAGGEPVLLTVHESLARLKNGDPTARIELLLFAALSEYQRAQAAAERKIDAAIAGGTSIDDVIAAVTEKMPGLIASMGAPTEATGYQVAPSNGGGKEIEGGSGVAD
jgi:hypothetical protein